MYSAATMHIPTNYVESKITKMQHYISIYNAYSPSKFTMQIGNILDNEEEKNSI